MTRYIIGPVFVFFALFGVASAAHAQCVEPDYAAMRFRARISAQLDYHQCEMVELRTAVEELAARLDDDIEAVYSRLDDCSCEVSEDECSFELPPNGGGSIVASNNPVVIVSAFSPSGSGVRGYNEVFRFNVENPGDCGDFTFKAANVWFAASDNAGTGWDVNVPYKLVNYSTGEVLSTGVFPSMNTATWVVADDVVPAGTATTYSLFVDTTFASEVYDDVIKTSIIKGGFEFVDSEDHHIYSDVEGLPANGGLIVY